MLASFYSQFERELRYAKKHEQKRVQYDEIRVTLHPVIGGNVRTRAISRKEFLKGRRRTAF